MATDQLHVQIGNGHHSQGWIDKGESDAVGNASNMEEQILQRVQQHPSEVAARPSNEQTSKPKDVFDQDNFDATAYINEMFPTGDSLRKLI